MTTVCIHQPDFAPWLGFFNRLATADVYVVLDDVQFIRRGWHHRDKIKTPRGTEWLTVPIRKKGNYHQLIRDVEIENEVDWSRVHLATLRANYGRAPCFDACMPELERIYRAGHRYLIDLNMALISFLCTALKLNVDIRYSSQLGHAPGVRRSELLLELVHLVRGSAYLTGQGSAEYLDVALFKARDIQVLWQEFQHPVYEQLHGPFVSNLSSLDALLNVGPVAAELVDCRLDRRSAKSLEI